MLTSAVSALGAAVRNDNIRRLELAWGASIAAEWAHFVALGVFAYQHGGAAAVGVAGLVRLLPAAVLAPFAASLGDRFRRERFLLAMTLVGAGALVASAAASLNGQRIPVFLFGALMGISSTLIRPVLTALLPSLARTPEELIASNATTSMFESIGVVAGPLFAGVVVALVNVWVVFIGGAAMLLIAATLLTRVRVEGRIRLAVEGQPTRRTIGAGFRAIVGTREPRLLVGLIVAQTFIRGCLNVFIVVAVFNVLHHGAAEVGYLTAALGTGGLVGALGATTLGGRRLATPFGLSLLVWGLPIALIAARPDFVTTMFLLALVGAANSVEDVTVFTLLQRTVPDDVLTASLGVTWGLAMGAVAIGSVAAPLIVSVVGPRPAFVAVGAILPLLAVATYRRLAEIDRTSTPSTEFELTNRVPMFAPLSIAMKDRIAAALFPVAVSAGEVVIRAGDAGDRFYIVSDGEFDIDAGGVHATALEGDHFGEIALLRSVPRSATVTATVDSHIYALQREAFLAAVTGHSAAHAVGQQVADARLARSGQ